MALPQKGSENTVLVRLLQIGATDLTVNNAEDDWSGQYLKKTNIHQHLPAASLGGGVGQQHLALKKLESMYETVLEEIVFRIKIHQH